MFESLSDKLQLAFRKLKGAAHISEKNIEDGLREVKLALLEADVNFHVVKDFIERVKQQSIGQEVLKSISPAQQIVKIVKDELTKLLGENQSGITFAGKPPTIIMMVGLQGSGKTTTAAKLALYLRKKNGKVPLLVAADVYRPAAIKQLEVLAGEIRVDFYSGDGEDPCRICKEAILKAKELHCDTVILDTAGRLHIDEPMMDELANIKKGVSPHEILFVADSMTGQDAVNVAKGFDDSLGIDGIVLTKLDGDARGGAALSIKSVTKKNVKFVGVSEKIEGGLEVFHPERVASRILGMGDVLSLVERAEEVYSEEASQKLEKKLKTNDFNLNDFKDQLGKIKKLGSVENIMKMIPGMTGKMKGLEGAKPDEKRLVRVEAIINSMTAKERRNHKLINGSRRKRIAKGSGTSVQEVNKMLKQFVEMRKMMKKLSGGKKFRGKGGLDMSNMFGKGKMPF